ncbi:MAG: lysophospholipase [Spirochaetaceae bacterium]|jgi:alpha-beta hydrolase superfamily lysophospholipase|nr:lysophospholipase [Spirochaetaceae bacterium]
MEATTLRVVQDDGADLFVRRWIPPETPRAILQLVHGMAEHSLRYETLAAALCERGIEVWAADQRGHGRTADTSVNSPSGGGLLGHCADWDGFFRVVSDVDGIFDKIEALHGNRPVFLLGHSWGSFIAQAYIERRGERLSGCALSGTRGPDGLKPVLGALTLSLIALTGGSRRQSKLARALVDGGFNRPFRPNRTPFDWLSRDEAVVDAYAADPLCGKLCSAGFYRDLIRGLREIHRDEALAGIPGKLPVYIFCGSADPVGDMGVSPTALVEAYKKHGISDLEYVLYPDARHEILNETNSEEVRANLVSWLERHL